VKHSHHELLKRDLTLLAAHQRHHLDRFLAEIDFVNGLVKLHPAQAKRWQKLVEQACEVVAEVSSSGKLDRLDKAVRRAEEILAPIGKMAKTYTVHCLGHAHLDMNWQWSWPETVAATNDTFLTVLKLMDEFPEFCFSQSQASIYELIRTYCPELFERIKHRIAEGRWEITASQWVEGDKNLASGESLARHLLYTRRFVREQFGLEPEDVTIAWEPDTFGHAHTIPTILSRGAVERYYLCRGGSVNLPPVFWWQGPDGSRILVNRELFWFCGFIRPSNAMSLLSFCEKTGLKDWLLVFGVGDHGGGPTRRDLIRCEDMNSWPIYPKFKFSTTRKYYAVLEKHGEKFPVLDREMNFEFAGCYTSQSAIKKINRLGENQLEQAEIAAMLAYRAVGRAYPAEALRDAWIKTLFGHFHDILPGSCVRATREYQSGLYQEAAAAFGMVRTHSLRALAAQIDTSFVADEPLPNLPPAQESIAMGAGVGRGTALGGISEAAHVVDGARAFVVFNPTSWQRDQVVSATIWDPHTGVNEGDIDKKQFVVHASDGSVIPAQRTGKGAYWSHHFIDVAFPVSVASLGYSAYVVEEGQAPSPQDGVVCHDTVDSDRISIRQSGMENEFLDVHFDLRTGGIDKLIDKKTGRNLADPSNPLGVLEYVHERPGEMSSWLIHPAQVRVCPLEVLGFRRTLTGPYVAATVASMKLNDSQITVTYTLRAGEPWLEISVSVNWLERGTWTTGCPTLRMQFPLALSDAKGMYEIPFGSIRRDQNAGEEVPSLRWADVTGKLSGADAQAGCALLNDSKYGHSLEGSTLRLTLIRSSYDPDPLPEIGEHVIRMAVAPHGKILPTADLVRMGAAFNHALQVVSSDVHKGRLKAKSDPVAAVRPDNVILSAVKKAEDEDALIFRLYETAGKDTEAQVTLDPTIMGGAADIVEVDLIERPLADSSARAVRGGFAVKIPAHGISSVKLTSGPVSSPKLKA